MTNSNIPFQTIDWTKIPKTEHTGESGTAFWQTVQLSGLRIRMQGLALYIYKCMKHKMEGLKLQISNWLTELEEQKLSGEQQ